MGLLDRLFARPDSTADWKPEPGLRLEVDLGRHALCGVRVGDPVEWLSRLGPAEDALAARRDGRYSYYTRGLEVGARGGRVTSYLLVWGGYADPKYQPFAGACTSRGKSLPLSADTREPEIARYFGEPYWRDEDEDEILLFYEFGEVEWQVELTLQGSLKAVSIVTPPLLADAAQRRAYRVSVAWPPERD